MHHLDLELSIMQQTHYRRIKAKHSDQKTGAWVINNMYKWALQSSH